MTQFIVDVTCATGIVPKDFFHALQIIERESVRNDFAKYRYNSQRAKYIRAKRIKALYAEGIKIIQDRLSKGE